MISKHKKTPYFMGKGLFSDLFSFKELEDRIANLPEAERGDAFEVFAEAYFKTQPIHQVEEIWPEKTLQQSLRELLNIPSDAGVDGVFKTLSGHYKAYQVKFRTNRGYLSWGGDSLGNFFGQADRVSERVLFTNSMDLSDLAASRINFYSIKGNELDCLKPSDFKTIEDWLKTGIIRRERLNLKDHQQKAIDAIIDELSVKDRTTAIMACGTGKTLVALRAAEKLEAKNILVLLPSLALIRQTLHDWARDHVWEKFHFLCVCSDNTVVNDESEMILFKQDLDFAVTTQPENIAAFLNNGNVSPKIIFSTYQSCRMVAQAMPAGFVFDLAIFDEAHKTSSRLATNHAFALSENNIAIKKRLFLTATPRHYNIDVKDKFGDNQLVFSMDDETIYGRVAYKLSFRAAVERDLICDYKVVISVITSDELNRELLKRGEVLVDGDIIKAQRIANILAIQNAVEKYGVKKIFSFHSSISAAKSFTAKTNEGIGAYLTDFATMHVSGEMSSSKRDDILNEFRNRKKALISNARCLAEGVNVPAVDMVAFVSPKKSKVDIVQAAGRAMRKHEDKTIGYILIPLFVQITENEILEEALNKTRFDTVWDVLQAMQEQDESLIEIIAKLRESRGKALGINDNRLRDVVEIFGTELLLSDLCKTITTKIIDKLGSNWDEKFGQLIRYKELFGHCNVAKLGNEYKDLGSWVGTQRRTYKKGQISSERIKKLESIGFEWDLLLAHWNNMFKLLCKYKNTYDDCNVPARYPKDIKLGKWVFVQRRRYKHNTLTQDCIDKLESLGFIWDPLDANWETMFIELSRYHAIYGNKNIKYKNKSDLAIWCQRQRKSYQQNNLSSNRIRRLESIEFIWDPFKEQWENAFAELLNYKNTYGDCHVPQKYKKNPKLANWLTTQKSLYKKNQLSPDRIMRLRSLGVIWDPLENKWNDMFIQLCEYKQFYKNCNVPKRYANNPKLGQWCQQQRVYYKQKVITKERILRLESIGFIWNTLIEKWDIMFLKLLEYYRNHGDCNVPLEYVKDPELGLWVMAQRNRHKNKKLSQVRIDQLNELKFVWDPYGDQWDLRYTELYEYFQLHGNSNLPQRYEINPQLGIWCNRQRIVYKRKNISVDRINKLELIKFIWDPYAAKWELMFAMLLEYKKNYGTCHVPLRYANNPKLGVWCQRQRIIYKQKKMSQVRIERLNVIGFIWDTETKSYTI